MKWHDRLILLIALFAFSLATQENNLFKLYNTWLPSVVTLHTFDDKIVD